MARFTTLYSGSSGNCAVVEEDGGFLMVDMGGSCKATLGAMVAAGLQPKNLRGILVTHEHSDHIKGLAVFLKRVEVPLYATAATLNALQSDGLVPPAARLVPADGLRHDIGGFEVHCFETSHDAAQSCGWHIETPAGHKMALATDLGVMTETVYSQLEDAALVALEANYDPVMLQLGRYPGYLKKRIASQTGHLANPEAAQTVARLVAAGCKKVALCHLSAENNRPQLVRQAMEEALLQHGLRLPQDGLIQIAKRYEVGDWMEF